MVAVDHAQPDLLLEEPRIQRVADMADRRPGPWVLPEEDASARSAEQLDQAAIPGPRNPDAVCDAGSAHLNVMLESCHSPVP